MLCPHMQFSDTEALLKALEPGSCCCYPDADGNLAEHHRHTNLCPARCQCRHSKESGKTDSEEKTDSGKKENGKPTSSGLHAQVRCPVCEAMVIWRRDRDSVYLECVNPIAAEAPASGAWIRKLNPHSWYITYDQETKHVFWCPDNNCRTNYKWYAMYARLGL